MNFWALFSGGKDSMATAYYLAETERLEGLVFLETGIGTHDLLPHVKRIAEEFDWSLEVYRTPYSYEDLVLKYGFPHTKRGHQWFMSYLKGRGVRQFKKAHPQSILASGVRKLESQTRGFTAKEWGEWEGVTTYAPILDWPTEKVWEYVRANDLPISPAYQALHISGDCLCGAFADKDELRMMEAFYPQECQRIVDLQTKRAEVASTRCKWGGSKTCPLGVCNL